MRRSTALVATTLPLIEGREQGWPTWSWLSLATAVVPFVAFAVYERSLKRRGAYPLIDFDLFKERAFSVGLFAQLIFYMSMAGFYLVFAIYVQEGRGLDALQAGTLFIANGVGYLASSSVARLAGERLGRQVLALAGLLRAIGLGVLALSVLGFAETNSVIWLVPGLFINGLGTGFAVAPLAANVLTRISPQHVGPASGVLTTGIQIGNAFGVAIIGMIFFGSLHGERYANAFGLSLTYLIGICLLLCLLVQFLPLDRGSGNRPEIDTTAKRPAG
jgi:predicted MFS family arabinose efflux permease